jgi:hypothetical protein
MMNLKQKLAIAATGILLIGGPIGCATNAGNGALIGGAAGAGLGAIVGHNSHGNTAGGALVGGAIGAVTGAIVGNEMDKAEARDANGEVVVREAPVRVYERRYYTSPPPPGYYYERRRLVDADGHVYYEYRRVYPD